MIDRERTLCIFKPDLAASDKNEPLAILRVLAIGLEPIVDVRMTLTRAQATELYREHAGRSYFEPNVEFVTSGPSYLMVLAGKNACVRLRELLGATDPAKAQPGTLRALYGSKLPRNAAHGSATPADAEREIALLFPSGAPMSVEEYQSAVVTAKLCANMLAGHDIPKLLSAIEHADAVGPILDPTLWRDKEKQMHEDKELLQAALKLARFGTRVG